VAKIEGWAAVAEPLHALMVEVEREAYVDRAAPLDLAAVSVQWARVLTACLGRRQRRVDDLST
jgi:hypothetical protein